MGEVLKRRVGRISRWDAIDSGLFLQEPESCSFCEFQPACGPTGAIAARRARQARDRDVVRYALLREVP